MTSPGRKTHGFVVRLWYEPREIESAAPEWRGWIECVATGERRYVRNVGEIATVIESYLTGPRADPERNANKS